MKASRNQDGTYCVEDGDKWWTAAPMSDGGWYILTGRDFRLVQEDGRLGRKIIAAIKDLTLPADRGM